MPHDGTIWPLWVVVLNWNLPGDTIACVESVLAAAQPLVAARVLIVGNGSTDDSVAQLRAAFVAGSTAVPVELLETGRNLGFARGMNAGARYALAHGAGSILFLNNDTEIDAEMLRHLSAILVTDPATGMVGPVIYYADPANKIWRFADNEHKWLPIPLRVPDAVVGGPLPPMIVDYITACAMLVRANVLRDVGLFDERYFMYYEDADLCRRVRDAGYLIRCVPQARMWHKVSVSANKEKAANRYARAWGRVRFYRSHPHGRLPWLVHGYIWGKVLLQSVVDLLRGETDLWRPLWRGTRDGYRSLVSDYSRAHRGALDGGASARTGQPVLPHEDPSFGEASAGGSQHPAHEVE